jgi:hypothetical protein
MGTSKAVFVMRVMRSKLGSDGVFITSYRASAASRSSSEMCASSSMTIPSAAEDNGRVLDNG